MKSQAPQSFYGFGTQLQSRAEMNPQLILEINQKLKLSLYLCLQVSSFTFLSNGQNQNNLPVTDQQSLIYQDQWMREPVPRFHQQCESRDAILWTFSRGYSRWREYIPVSDTFREEHRSWHMGVENLTDVVSSASKEGFRSSLGMLALLLRPL